MHRRRTIVIILVIVVAFGLLVARRLKDRRAESAMLDATKPSPTLVVGALPLRQPMRETLRVAGTVMARAQVALVPKVAGRIARLLVEEGAFVRPGQLLAEIEHGELTAQLAQADAAVASAQAAISQGRINLLNAESDEERNRALIKDNAISQQAWESAQVRTKLAREQVQASIAQLAQAKANIRYIQAELDNYRVTAPISGQITQRQVDPGAMASVNAPLFTLAQTGSFHAEFDLPERQLTKLHDGQAVIITSLAQPERPVRARLTEISPVVDPQSRLVHVKADLPAGGFRAGMSVDGEFILAESAAAMAIPLEAVTVDGDVESVMVEDHGRAAPRRVRTGMRNLKQVEILSGLTPEDKVIVAGQTFVKAGDPVNVEISPGSDQGAKPVPSPSAKGA